MKGVSRKKTQFRISLKSFSLSRILKIDNMLICINFVIHHLLVRLSSARTWLKSLRLMMKRTAVTLSKHWIHFFLSDLWPPTSTNSNRRSLLLYKDIIFQQQSDWSIHLKRNHYNPWGHWPSSEDVLVCGQVILWGQPLGVGEEIWGRVTELDMLMSHQKVVILIVTWLSLPARVCTPGSCQSVATSLASSGVTTVASGWPGGPAAFLTRSPASVRPGLRSRLSQASRMLRMESSTLARHVATWSSRSPAPKPTSLSPSRPCRIFICFTMVDFPLPPQHDGFGYLVYINLKFLTLTSSKQEELNNSFFCIEVFFILVVNDAAPHRRFIHRQTRAHADKMFSVWYQIYLLLMML